MCLARSTFFPVIFFGKWFHLWINDSVWIPTVNVCIGNNLYKVRKSIFPGLGAINLFSNNIIATLVTWTFLYNTSSSLLCSFMNSFQPFGSLWSQKINTIWEQIWTAIYSEIEINVTLLDVIKVVHRYSTTFLKVFWFMYYAFVFHFWYLRLMVKRLLRRWTIGRRTICQGY